MAPRKRQTNVITKSVGRTILFLVLAMALLIFVLIRVIFIKTVHGEEYQTLAEKQQVESTDVVIPALRGSITDRNGNMLAESARVYNVILDCQVLIEAKQSDQASTIEQLMQTLGLSDENIIRQYMTDAYREYRYLKLKEGEGISVSQMEEIQAAIDKEKVVGVWFEEAEDRQYVNDSLAAHVVGFNGSYGVEQYYDKYLSGVEGRKMVVASTGNSFVEEYIPAEDGKHLTLTIDTKVQYYMEEVLQQGLMTKNAINGCAICMNPKTGEIYGLAVAPTFNLNNPQEVVGASKKYNKLHDENSADYASAVWTNYAITLAYDPGSTFKPIFASAAMNEAVIGEQDTLICTGYYDMSTEYEELGVQCAGRTVHGTQTVGEIIMNSCNIGMTKMSEKLTVKKWLQYQEAFGLGQLTGIDLVGEGGDSDLLIYMDPQEALAKDLPYSAMYSYQKATTAFGQGFKVTPIQLITAFSAVINGGEYLEPYVVSQITDSNGDIIMSQSKEILRHPISEGVSKLMRDYMYGTVTAGTGQEAKVAGYEIGGKTGTAQKYDEKGDVTEDRYVVSFIGYTPVDDPEVVLLVILDEADGGSSHDTAELASQMFEKILPALGLYPDSSLNQDVPSPNEGNDIDLGNAGSQDDDSDTEEESSDDDSYTEGTTSDDEGDDWSDGDDETDTEEDIGSSEEDAGTTEGEGSDTEAEGDGSIEGEASE